MSAPATAFDRPQFDLLPGDTYRNYANVCNRLQWVDAQGRTYDYSVVVHTSLFTIMSEVLKVHVDDSVTMYIADVGRGFYVFGITWGEEDFCDLWSYTYRELPPMFK